MAKLFSWGKNSPDEATLIEALRQGADWAYEHLYINCYPSIKRYVVNQGGSEDDAQEVFQEAIIELLKNLRDSGFQLTVKVCTYLFAIAKYKWWDINKKRSRYVPFDADPLYTPGGEADPLDGLPPVGNTMGMVPEEQDELFTNEEIMEFITNMGVPCTDTLRKHYIDEIPLKEMAKEAGISEEAMRKRSFDCRKKVRNHFKNK